MSERTLNKIEEVKGIDLNYVDRITFYSHYDENGRDYETTASMAFWNEEEFRWGAEILEEDKIPRGDRQLTEASIRYRLKQWGVKPTKVKWDIYKPDTFEDFLRNISARRHSFVYTEQHTEDAGSDEAIVFTAVTVEYNTEDGQYKVYRNRMITGAPDAVRESFVKYVSQAIDWHPVIKVYEQDKEN